MKGRYWKSSSIEQGNQDGPCSKSHDTNTNVNTSTHIRVPITCNIIQVIMGSLTSTNKRSQVILAIQKWDKKTRFVFGLVRISYFFTQVGISSHIHQKIPQGHIPREVYEIFQSTEHNWLWESGTTIWSTRWWFENYFFISKLLSMEHFPSIRQSEVCTSISALMFWNFCLWSVTCRQLEINPRETAADHCRCSCSYWNSQPSRNFDAVDLTACADWGKTWKQQKGKRNEVRNNQSMICWQSKSTRST